MSRKNLALGALLVGVVLVNYGLHRARPALARLTELTAEADALDARGAELAATGGPSRDAALERRVAHLQRELVERRTRVEAADRRWAREDQAADLAWQVAALARETRLRIESEELAPRQTCDDDDGPLAAVLQGAPFARPTHAYTISGRYADLWRFLDRLGDLPWEALVVDLQIEQPQHLDHPDLPLAIKLVVAL